MLPAMPTAEPGAEPAKGPMPAAAFLTINRSCFYFDLSAEQSHVVDILGSVLPRYGAVQPSLSFGGTPTDSCL